MKHNIRAFLMIGIAIGTLAASEKTVYAQGADPNAAPNPYKMEETWARLPDGRKFGASIKVQVDHSDGKSIWVFDRCGLTECTNSMIAPIERFDASGAFQKAFGAGMFAVRMVSMWTEMVMSGLVTKLPGTVRAQILSSSALTAGY